MRPFSLRFYTTLSNYASTLIPVSIAASWSAHKAALACKRMKLAGNLVLIVFESDNLTSIVCFQFQSETVS